MKTNYERKMIFGTEEGEKTNDQCRGEDSGELMRVELTMEVLLEHRRLSKRRKNDELDASSVENGRQNLDSLSKEQFWGTIYV